MLLSPADVLRDRWGWPDVCVQPHHGGMNSATWWVDSDGARSVAKWVPLRSGAGFLAGLQVAMRLERDAVPCGGPIPARDGSPAIEWGDGLLAMLRFVPGRALGPADGEEVGRTLAEIHRRLAGVEVPGAATLGWVEPDGPHLRPFPEVSDSVRAAAQALSVAQQDGLTIGVGHGDPATECFLRSGETTGVIDWASCVQGPLMYDVASVVMYLGGPARASRFLASYVEQGGPVRQSEVEDRLEVFLTYRWAVQADYFARRLAENDLTGIASHQDNWRGLNDAAGWLLGHGPST